MQIKQDQMFCPINPGVTFPYYTRIQIYPGSYVNMRCIPLPIEPSAIEPYYTRMQIYPDQTSPLNEANATEPTTPGDFDMWLNPSGT